MQEGRRRPAPDVAQPARVWGAADGGNQIAPGAFASNGIAECAGSDAVVPTSVGSTVGLSVRVQRSVIALSMTRESGRKSTYRGCHRPPGWARHPYTFAGPPLILVATTEPMIRP
jgi:hypothetical protein